MRLAQLHVREDTYQHHDGRTDHRALLRQLATELGCKEPALSRWWDDDEKYDSSNDVNAAIALWKHATQSDNPSETYPKTYGALTNAVNMRLRDIEGTAEAFKHMEEVAGDYLPSIKGIGEALERVESQVDHVKEVLKMVSEVFQLLNSINSHATTKFRSGEDPEDTKWKSSIARAGLRKMGLEPVDQ